VIILDHYFDTAMMIFHDGGNPICNLKIKEGYTDSVYEGFKRCEQLDEWKHGELPERFHYGNNPRTHDITVAAKTGWTQKWSWKKYHNKGAHGYDNENKDMHGIFYAIGPAFKNGYTKDIF
jgi:Type I phosphodiesterase / nucleotide pyrophosphatase.